MANRSQTAATRRTVKVPKFKQKFSGRVLLLGCGSVSQCLQPLLLRHLDMDFRKLTVMDFEDLRSKIPDTLAAGATYSRSRITRENIATLLGKHVGPGDLLIDLAWNIDAATNREVGAHPMTRGADSQDLAGVGSQAGVPRHRFTVQRDIGVGSRHGEDGA